MLIFASVRLLAVETIDQMEPVDVKSETLKGYGLYNLYLEYVSYEKSIGPKTFHFIGFSPQKKPTSQSNLPFKKFVVSPLGKKTEIFPSNEIYSVQEKYRDHRITSNQPFLSETDYFIYRFTPTKTPTGLLTKGSLEEMQREFNDFLKARCKFIDHAGHGPPFVYQLKQARKTTADICVICCDDASYLSELNYRQLGKITGNALIFPAKALAQLPPEWGVDSERISHTFPWNNGAALPRTSSEGVWFWCGVTGWAWQKPNGWCLPQFKLNQ